MPTSPDSAAAAGNVESVKPVRTAKRRRATRSGEAPGIAGKSVVEPAGSPGVRRVVFAVLCLVIAAVSGDWRVEAATPAEIRQALQAATSGSIQTALPEERADQPQMPDPEPRVDRPDFGDLSELGEVLRVLLWALVAAAIALVVFSIVTGRPILSARPRQTASRDDLADQGAGDPRRRDMEASLAEADRLASDGAYAEALHTLLQFCLAELRRVADGSLSPALTSREVLHRPLLSGDAQAALGPLVDAVEVSHFGGRLATEDDYRACRAGFHRFAEMVLGGAA